MKKELFSIFSDKHTIHSKTTVCGCVLSLNQVLGLVVS